MSGLLRLLKRSARASVQSTQDVRDRLRWREFSKLQDTSDRLAHIRAAAEWLKRAQDAGSDRGVSYGATLGGTFQKSYPETTGYIIPTFLSLAEFWGDKELERRAVEMGDWEIAIQMDCGAVMGGIVNANPTPAIFNTGQVLLGWSALYRCLKEKRFLDAAERAARWMASMQNADGNWIKGNSQFAAGSTTLYNVKAAWGLLEAGQCGNWPELVEAATRKADYCLTKQLPNGWFADCCLTNPARPLLHTIAYTMQGLVSIGILGQRPQYIAAAEKCARSLMSLMDADGFIPGRIDAQFRGTTNWCCLTGTAQTSIVWSQLYQLTGDETFRTARHLANRYLAARHNIASKNPAFRGGLFGSWPFWGEYGRNTVLNWAAKFFIDALLFEERSEQPETGTNVGEKSHKTNRLRTTPNAEGVTLPTPA